MQTEVQLAMGRMFRLMSRPFQDGDIEQYKKCRSIILAATCIHQNISQPPGSHFQYCEDCGAVRSQLSGKIGQFDEWHVCELCRLPGAA